MTNESNPKPLCSSRIAALIWRLLIAAMSGYGLVLLFRNGMGFLMCYFTVQSNLLLLAMFLYLAAGTFLQLRREGGVGTARHLPPWIQLGVVFLITITFLVYWFMLSGTMFSMSNSVSFSNVLLHYVAPVMAILDWIVFVPHGSVTVRHAACWLSYPAAYVVFSYIRAFVGPAFPSGSRFPYPFMDLDLQGLGNILWICPVFFLAAFALGCVYVGADRLLARRGLNIRK